MNGKRSRTMSRLKVMNANDDIPEEPSPVKQNGGGEQRLNIVNGSTSRAGGSSKSAGWLSAEEEKKRLYEHAKAQVERVHGRAASFEQHEPVSTFFSMSSTLLNNPLTGPGKVG